MHKLTGTLTEIQQAESLLIEGREVQHIHFAVTSAGSMSHRFVAASNDGTAFATLQNDPRYRPGVAVSLRHHRRICVGIRLLRADGGEKDIETDIERLKNRAQRNLMLPKGELYALLDAFDADSVQAYALALHLKQQGEKTENVLALTDKNAVCSECKQEVHVSPRRAYAWGDTFCNSCEKNVQFNLLEPIPREKAEPPPSLEEIQEQLKKRFG